MVVGGAQQERTYRIRVRLRNPSNIKEFLPEDVYEVRARSEAEAVRSVLRHLYESGALHCYNCGRSLSEVGTEEYWEWLAQFFSRRNDLVASDRGARGADLLECAICLLFRTAWDKECPYPDAEDVRRYVREPYRSALLSQIKEIDRARKEYHRRAEQLRKRFYRTAR